MWNYREIDLGTEFAEAIGFNDMSNVTPEIIINNMKEICENNDIPAHFEEASFTVGGAGSIMDSLAYGQKPSILKAFNKHEFRAVRISHPNPPQDYCSQLYILYSDGIRFFYVGQSKAFKERNEYENMMNGNSQGVGLKGRLKAIAGIRPDEEPYNLEMEWHNTIYSVFCSLLE